MRRSYISIGRALLYYTLQYTTYLKKESSYISQTLYWGLRHITTYHTIQVCAGISQHFPFITHGDDYGTFTVIHHRDGSEVAAFISVKAAIAKLVIRWKGKQFQHTSFLKYGSSFTPCLGCERNITVVLFMDTKSGILVPFYLFYYIRRNDITQSDIISIHTYPNTSTQCFASSVSSISILTATFKTH